MTIALANILHNKQLKPIGTSTTSLPQTVRVLTGSVGVANTSVRVLTSGQTLRLATTQAAIIRNTGTGGSNVITSIAPTSLVSAANTNTSGTIAGKQFFIQKPFSLGGQNVQLQLVKTSTGMAVQTVPKMNVLQKSRSGITVSVAVSQSPTSGSCGE